MTFDNTPKPRIVFIIPLKAKERSQDWENACELLERTLTSIDGQTCRSFRTVLVCNEPPILSREYDNLTVLQTDIRIDGEYSTPKGRLDKRRKVLFGLLHAREFSPDCAMTVDADDAIHKRLVDFVDQDRTVDAFLMNRGYTYHIGKKRLRKIPEFHYLSGSTIIYPVRDEDFKDIRSHLDVDDFFMTRQAHPKPAEELLKEKGIAYKYIPFYAGIYVRGHDDSIRDAQAKEHEKIGLDHYSPSLGFERIRYVARRAFNRVQAAFVTRPIDATVLEEFPGFTVMEK